MRLNLGSIIHTPGGVVPFRFFMDLSWMEHGGQHPASEPVLAEGSVVNKAGVLLLEAELSTNLHCVCDRCAAAFERSYSQKVKAVLVSQLQHEENEDDWVFLLQGEEADLEEIMNTAFVLNLDSKLLCRPDCRGLCPKCGKNLNEGPCSCKKELDPRLAVLGQLLKDKE